MEPLYVLSSHIIVSQCGPEMWNLLEEVLGKVSLTTGPTHTLVHAVFNHLQLCTLLPGNMINMNCVLNSHLHLPASFPWPRAIGPLHTVVRSSVTTNHTQPGV